MSEAFTEDQIDAGRRLFGGPSRFLLGVAKLERSRTCGDRQKAIAEIDEAQDKRALPALTRIADSARTGCGFLGLSDCYGCVRADARAAVASINKHGR